ncbi:UDP-glucose 4-epimerase family protein [Pseudomonas sp. 44 R 15]|uniref:UDP-glucose 4-epimerase family protein n=1 Tax=Pseudomonas sp. 44 R 15 TaxID=1844105 RepID=UPI0008129473|nr:SDR family oxidoreductase [Pseudomonas sp. 44 R 15]CRM48028.1 GDP-6-deoxy-D-mannose reductase [Pseudomonas sp. 44 R 15]
MRIFVTGASGFVGSRLVQVLSARTDVQVTVAVRDPGFSCPGADQVVQFDDLSRADFSGVLTGVEAVVHCAARVHVMNDSEADPLEAFRRVNVQGTLALAHQAAQAGVRRFVFLSSIKVNGEGTVSGAPYTADQPPAPSDPYGISKMEAEQGLLELAATTGMEVVIIRPVLVYGPGVKANFLSMMRWLHKGVPLPFGAIHNARSLVALDNLVDLSITCITHPAAANQVFMVSDGEDLSTTVLLRKMASALGKPARLLPVPASLLSAAAITLGKRSLSQRLCGSLQVDIGKTRTLLGWTPPLSVDEALKVTASAYMESQNT